MTMNRRNFLVLSTCGAVASVAAAKTSLAQTPPTGPVQENEALAVAMGFYKDATKVDLKKWAKKAAADGKDQLCKNCQVFAADPTNKGMGKCTIFQMRLVPDAGWCNGWVKKV